MELYKLCKFEHFKLLQMSGTLRIGTLYDYRREDDLGKQVGDAAEGIMRNVWGSLPYADATTLESVPLLQSFFGRSGLGPVRNLRFEGCEVFSPNLYIFSSSDFYDQNAHDEWHRDPDARYDACYQISSARLFFRAISNVLSTRADFLGYEAVQYHVPEVPIDVHSEIAGTHPALLKSVASYSHQAEVRAAWSPRGHSDIQPFFVDVPEVRKYCSMYKLLDRLASET